MIASTEHADVVVVGGGPAGSTIATLVARRGHRVVLLERETFPRYQIGESLLPATVHGICRLLGVEEEIANAGFMRKHGGTFQWGANPRPWTFSFAASERFPGPTSFAYQVERMKFDLILLENAKRSGVEVRESCTATATWTASDRIGGVRYRDDDGGEHEITASYVVDASGNSSRLHGDVGGKRDYSAFFRNVALFGYYGGGKRLPHPHEGNILCSAFPDGWFWYIPLSDDLTSVGAVIKRESAEQVQGDPEVAMASLIESCPLIADHLADAKRVRTGPYGRLRVRKDYSYCGTAFWRPGMVLVGDAACFVDPVFSSGVHLATYGALLAARSINTVLAGELEEVRSFGEFESRYRREYQRFYQFLLSFYELHVDEKSYFWQAKKITKCASSELESFVNLVGGLASDEPVLGGSAGLVDRRVRADAAELADAVARSAGDPTTPLFATRTIAKVMQEGTRTQVQAMFGAGLHNAPIFDGGLIVSPDNLGWQEQAA